MEFDRRRTLGLLGSAIAAPYVMRSASAVPAVEYVNVCGLYGKGFYYIPGTDTTIRIGANGGRVSWINFPHDSFTEARAYTQSFGFDGQPTSGPVKLGNPKGLTTGVPAAGVAGENLPNSGPSEGLIYYGAPPRDVAGKIGIYSQRVSEAGAELNKPVLVTLPFEGTLQTLFSTPLSNGNFAIAYTAQLGSGISVSMQITNSDGAPIGPAKTVAHSTDGSIAFLASSLVANDSTIFCTFEQSGNSGSKFGVQRLDSNLSKTGLPTWITPPNGKTMFGSPAVLPGAAGDFQTFFQTTGGSTSQTGRAASPTADLYFRQYGANGKPGVLKHCGSHAVDSTASSISDGPSAVQTADGHYVVMTAGVGQILASYVDSLGVKIDRQTFVKKLNRKMRNRRLVRFSEKHGIVWHEINDTDPRNVTITWHARVFTIQ